MALKSMTGYGRGQAAKQGRVWTVEVRCVNNRFLDIKIKMPRDYGILEDSIRKKIGEYHQRGRVELTLSVSGDFSDLIEVRVDTNLALAYKQSLETLADQLEVDCQIDAGMLAEFPNILVPEQRGEDIEKIRSHIEEAIEEALISCHEMREREAATLTDDLIGRLQNFSAVLDQIEKNIPVLLRQREEALKERLDKLLGMINLDPMRLAQEVAIIADKTDVTEELVRLRSHISQFNDFLQASESVGRKLDFLIQEFLREVNTMASKINDATIAHMAVNLKSELEKMREQVQNIE